jgi:drug/metabolite transporter (DMT)-like permease
VIGKFSLPLANKPASAAWIGTINYFLASMFWGLNIPLTASLLKTIDPFWLSPIRYVIAATVLALWVVCTLGYSQLRSPVPMFRVATLSLCVATFLTCFNLGLMYTDSITAAAVMAGSPVYVAVVSRFMIGAKLERGFWGAAILTMVGAGIAVYGRVYVSTSAGGSNMGPNIGSNIGSNVGLHGGEVLLVLSTACWTVYSILAQRWFPATVSQLRRTFLTTITAVPWLVLFWVLARLLGLVGEPNLHPNGAEVINLLLTAVFASALAVVAWNNGVAKLGINAGSVWQNMVPVFAVVISVIFFGLVPTVAQVIGGIVVLSGVLYFQWHKLRYRSENQRAARTATGAAP